MPEKELRRNLLAIRIFVKFGYNYNDVDEFLDYICEKTGKMWLKDQLKNKFMEIYDMFGCHAVMNYFFCEIDLDLQEALVDYALNVYGPVGMKCDYEEYKYNK